jgi:hypothetical protein
MMKKLVLQKFLLLILLSVICVPVWSQIRITGIVSDIENKIPIEYANVVLLQQDSSFVKSIQSDKDGKFTLDGIKRGDYIISVTFIGYEPTFVLLKNINTNLDLGDIYLPKSDILLNDVTITANSVIRKPDRQIILLTETQVKAANSGITLLRNLQLPRVSVNPINNTISSLDGGAVQLRINGIEVSQIEITALNPADILRIEYYDDPGLRYGSASIVLDYITRKKESGGNISTNLTNAVPGIGENYFSAKYNHKKSEFSTDVYWGRRDLEWTRENHETFVFPDKILQRIEEGEPATFKYDNVNVSFNYNLQETDKYLFNVRLRSNSNDTPNELGDRVSSIIQGEDRLSVYDHSVSKSNSPSVDMYYQQNLKNSQSLIFNIVGTYINTENTRTYQEKRKDAIMTDIYSDIEGKKYSLISEGIYENRMGNNKFSGGIKHTQSYTKNNYQGYVNTDIKMNFAETYLYAEYQLNHKKLNYTFGLGGMRTYNSQGDLNNEKYIFRPTLRIAYNVNDNLFIRYNGYISGYSPALSDLNNIEQSIDSLQIRRGNPLLKSVIFYSNTLSAGWRKGILGVELLARYSYDDKPIMESVKYENGKFIRLNENQKGFHRLRVQSTIQLQPFKEYISISLTPWVNRYISEGHSYIHTHTNCGIRGSLMAVYKNWNLITEMNTRNNDLWGETLTEGERIHSIFIGYNTERWSVSAGALNPFSKRYDLETKNQSSLISSKQLAYTDKLSQMVMVNFSINLNLGRQYNSGNKRLQNEDSNSGILSGKK